MRRPVRSWFGLLGVGLLVALTGTGCSAIFARTRINDAMNAVTAADNAGAAKKAPYEYTNALLYLEKAREEEAYARFGPAMELSDTCSEFAEKARAVATGEARPAADSTSPKP
jgi:hypothetical protein